MYKILVYTRSTAALDQVGESLSSHYKMQYLGHSNLQSSQSPRDSGSIPELSLIPVRCQLQVPTWSIPMSILHALPVSIPSTIAYPSSSTVNHKSLSPQHPLQLSITGTEDCRFVASPQTQCLPCALAGLHGCHNPVVSVCLHWQVQSSWVSPYPVLTK